LIFSGRQAERQNAESEVAPHHLEARTWPSVVYAIGDVHGCFTELKSLLDQIKADARVFTGEKWLVLLGDYIDRGPASSAVLDWLIAQPPAEFRRIAIAGNHERMMLDFLADPQRNRRWLEYGGTQTLRSYGIDDDALMRRNDRDTRRMLESYIPPDHFALLRRLPLTLSLPGMVFVHAAFRPGIPVVEQSESDLLWGVPAVSEGATAGDPCVVHGHIPAMSALISPYRICVDTGAFATGILTAVRLTPRGAPQLFQTSPRAGARVDASVFGT
jgi:serine/threonine protein phosphatase 1